MFRELNNPKNDLIKNKTSMVPKKKLKDLRESHRETTNGIEHMLGDYQIAGNSSAGLY
jgi:hypothetical protein